MNPSHDVVMRPAVIDRRIGAYAIDVGIAVAVPLMLVSMVFGAAFGLGAMIGATAVWPQQLVPALLIVSWAGWALVYTVMQGGAGSIGQRLVGLRLADAETGDRIGFGRALARNVVFHLAVSIVVGFFTPLFDRTPRHQGWHDLAARACVVDARATAAAAVPLGASALAPAAVPAYRARVTSDPADRAPGHSMPAEPRRVDPVEEATVLAYAATMTVARSSAPALALAGVKPGRTPAGVVDATPSAASRTLVAQPAPAHAGHPVLAVLTWDDGSRLAVYGPTVFGRNPVRDQGVVALALRDETLSLSKTHFEIGGDPDAAWIIDRFSTNGTTLVRDGDRIELPAGPAHSAAGGRSAGVRRPQRRGGRCSMSPGESPLTVAWGAASDPGLRRALNEDSFLAAPPLFLVADGMGGHRAGEIASATVIEEFATYAGRPSLSIQDLHTAVDRARRRVVDLPPGEGAGAGTTLSGVVICEVDGDAYWLAVNLGDSRTYRLSEGELEQISVDHSVVQELIDSGVLTADAAARDSRRNVITRAIGGGSDSEADYWLLPAEAGDRILVCSDGLPGELDRDAIHAILLAESDPQAAATRLVHEAMVRGGRDNITALVVDATAIRAGAPASGASPSAVDDEIDGDTRPRVPTGGGA